MIARRFLRHALYRRTFPSISQEQWIPIVRESKLLPTISWLAPLTILALSIRILRAALPEGTEYLLLDGAPFMIRAAAVLLGFISLDKIIALLGTAYEQSKAGARRPIRGYVLFLRWFIALNAGVILVSLFMGQSPWTLLTGLGAASAFLGLIFRNTLLSFASGIQLAMNDVVEVGDWIEAPDLGVNGTVSQMTFHAVRIQNWDKTLVAIPTYKLVEHPFKNWRGMAQFGCRRMKRQILIDPNSIRLQSEKASPKQPLLASEGSTNVERFRSQVLQALRQDPRIQTSITHMVRLLPPAPTGALPIEVYAFVTVTV